MKRYSLPSGKSDSQFFALKATDWSSSRSRQLEGAGLARLDRAAGGDKDVNGSQDSGRKGGGERPIVSPHFQTAVTDATQRVTVRLYAAYRRNKGSVVCGSPRLGKYPNIKDKIRHSVGIDTW